MSELTNVTLTDRAGLSNFFTRLRQGDPVTVAYLGGSITEGAGASDPEVTSWRALLSHWLTMQYPAAITSINAGIGGTPSDLGAFRLEHDVLRHKPDLIFIEFAVNDGDLSDALITHAMEGIVRHARHALPSVDLCLVYTLHRQSLPVYAADSLPRTVRLHEAIAAHYDLPSVDLGAEIARQLRAGELAWEDFAGDDCHPTDIGHHLFADILTQTLARIALIPNVESTPKLLPPLSLHPIDRGNLLQVKDTAIKSEWVQEDGLGHFVSVLASDFPGSVLEMDFAGRILGVYYLLGPDTGAFEYTVDKDEWTRIDPFDIWATGGYRRHNRILETSLAPGAHRLHLRTVAESHPDSLGQTTRLAFLLADSLDNSDQGM